jgi:hypothetical protein
LPFYFGQRRACKSRIESRVFAIQCVAFTSKPLLSCALSGWFHDRGGAGSTKFRSVEKNFAQYFGFRMPGGETLSVNLTRRVDGRVSVFVADFPVAVDVAIVETCVAHGALHCAYPRA